METTSNARKIDARSGREQGILRDEEELEGSLLPTASIVEGNNPTTEEHSLPVAYASTAITQVEEEAPLVPPEPSDHVYKQDDGFTLAVAKQRGRVAAKQEVALVARQNHTIPAYNNQEALNVDRANEVARWENHRERQLQTNPALLMSGATATKPSASIVEENKPYFSSQPKGGYQIKEYDFNDYNDNYSYDISEYNSVYDD